MDAERAGHNLKRRICNQVMTVLFCCGGEVRKEWFVDGVPARPDCSGWLNLDNNG